MFSFHDSYFRYEVEWYLTSRAKKQTKPWFWLDVTILVVVLNPCDLVPWISESMAAFHWFEVQLLWMSTVIFFYLFLILRSIFRQPTISTCGLPFGRYSIPYQLYKISPWYGDCIKKMFIDFPFHLVTADLHLDPFLKTEKKAPMTEWQLVPVFPPVTSNHNLTVLMC